MDQLIIKTRLSSMINQDSVFLSLIEVPVSRERLMKDMMPNA